MTETKIVDFKGYSCKLIRGVYTNKRTALWLIDKDTEEPICCATINIPEIDLPEGYVFIKNWNENEGILDALIEARIVEAPQTQHPLNWVTAYRCRLIED